MSVHTAAVSLTGSNMELRGVCVLLGVLLLVHWSVQQNQPRRKPVKKGTASISDLPELLLFNQVSLVMLTCR